MLLSNDDEPLMNKIKLKSDDQIVIKKINSILSDLTFE